ncbi:hypothetical protein [Psychrobacillus vulpis]|uniref:Uncharacterized protein n=1 Tax=Psychrobacillus vulpis TaxID=2325572 RepID=A0A544TU87_9BACI|nr:hypothetical protein [Psychrobacillus vulpis]TQR21011.1 hypothetical protein FG384_05300 [Psychrobacillus vulpis]
MDDFKSLQVLDRFKWIFQKFHIDYEIMRKILQLKLTMDGRRMPTVFNGSKVKKEGNQFIKSLWMYGFLGLLTLTPFLFLGDQFIFFTSIMMSILMFILMTLMVSDFSAVLLDVRDKNILHSKPISTITINAAKIVHILIYMFLLTGSFVAIPLVVSIFKHGIGFALIFAIEIIFIGCLVVVLTAFVYLFILRFFSGEKLKDIINYVQIFLSIAVIVGYQLVARSFEIVNLNISYTFDWWHLLLPPIWFGAPFELLLNKDFSFHIILLTIFAVLTPIFSVMLYIRLMPAFERNLVKLLSDSNRKKKKSRKIAKLWSKVLCRTTEEQTFFSFSSLMMKQERDLKLKIYPQLGIASIFPFIFLFNDIRMDSYEVAVTGNGFMFVYFSLLMIPNVVHMLKFSSNFKGHWIYRAAPIENEFSIYRSTLKACIVNYFLPVYFLVSAIFIYIFSVRIIPDLLIVLLVAIAMTLFAYVVLNGETYPFSNTHEHSQDISTFKVLGSILFIGIFALVHFFVLKITYGIYVYMILLVIGNVIGWRLVFPRKIKKIQVL